jgi:NAD(P)H dehydrogenase (quinone)
VPVVVTGASGRVGRAAVRAFAARSPEVRAFVRDRANAEELRRLGAKVAVGAIDDVDTLATVMRGAHSVCHLIGSLDLSDAAEYERVNTDSVRWTLEAAVEAGVKRFLFVSYPGADPGSSNAFLRAKGLAERAIEASPIDHVILRCTHVLPAARVARRVGPWSMAVAGTGTQRIAPIHAVDVASVLAAADDRATVPTGMWGLQGPDVHTAEEFARMIGGRILRTIRGPAARRRLGLTVTAAEVAERDSLADTPDAAAEFRVALTPLRQAPARA